MAILNSFLTALSTGDNVRDYKHASKTFVDGNYRLAPKHRFLFHCTFGINPGLGFNFAGSEQLEASFLVKNVDLPKYSYELAEHNQYNRKRYTYNKINYDPVRLTFHDDNSDIIRNMWYAYYAFYNNDPNYESGGTYSLKDTYTKMPNGARNWGLDRNSGQFFSHIKIYSIYQKKYTEYWLVNPIIQSFEHDRHDYADSQGLMENSMTVKFETVKYKSGLVDGDGPAGFGEMHYDKAASPLTPQGGGTTSVFGPGGLVDAAGSIGSDLSGGNIAGAVVTGLRGAQNLKGANLKSMLKSELTGMATNALRGNNPIGDFKFPSSGSGSTGGANPLPNVPKVGTVAGNFIPPSQNKIASNGVKVGANLKQPLANALGKFNLQSLEDMSSQAFSLVGKVTGSLPKSFGNLSGFVDNPDFQTNFQNDLGKAQNFMSGSGPGSFKGELGKAFGKNLSASPKGVTKVTKGLPAVIAT
jgi:hypothetical protein